jgi:PAS domain S-box-containing protein
MPLAHTHPVQILDSLSEGVFTINQDFKITFFNSAAERIMGYQRGEVLYKYCRNIFSTQSCFDNCPISLVLEGGKNVYDFKTQFTHKNGERIRVRLNAAMLYNGEGEMVGSVISFQDVEELESLREKIKSANEFHGMIGQSHAMREIFTLIEEISESDATVLIQGESGTGKEKVVNAIQETSTRKQGPYVKVNCAVFPPQLLASELFGHVKGAFTDAIRDREGRFQTADSGTLFLDEIGEMPLQMQLQLLRVLQEGTFERVGESTSLSADVRVIAASNKDLKTAICHQTFREDLYYRLNVIPIFIPPLRERREDIPFLVDYFLKKFSFIYKRDIYEIDDQAMDLLYRHNWPGNIRELENAIEYAFARSSRNASTITVERLPKDLNRQSSVDSNSAVTSPVKETHEIIELLEKYHWNKSKVSEVMGIGRTTLWRKMKTMGLG